MNSHNQLKTNSFGNKACSNWVTPIQYQAHKDTGLVKIQPTGQLQTSRSISETDVIRLQPLIEQYTEFWLVYPDKFVEMCTPPNSHFKLEDIQQLVLRCYFRYEDYFLVATRGFSKSFIGVGAKLLKCVLVPGAKEFICADTQKQANAIAQQKISEWLNFLPVLKNEINYDRGSKTSNRQDNITIEFKNGSTIDLITTNESYRGLRRTGGLVEEAIKVDQTGLNEVVVPMASVARRTILGDFNENEPAAQLSFATSAGYKSTYAYEKAIETLIKSAIQSNKACSMGFDYKVPVAYGLLDANAIKKVKLSPTYSDASFSREYGSRWSGSSEEALFSFDKLTRYRTLKMFEGKPRVVNPLTRYYLSVDVGRARDRTALVIFKVLPQKDFWRKSIVNIIILDKVSLQQQGRKIKELDEIFSFDKIVVDANGLGQSLIDFLCENTTDENGRLMPGYNVINTDDHPQYKDLYSPEKATKLWALMTNQHSAGQIHLNCFNTIAKGEVRFLISETVAKQKFMSQKTFQQKPLAQRLAALMPYKNTSILINETVNLKPEDGATQHLKLVYISSGAHKDLFSAMEYGLWIIRKDEDAYYKGLLKAKDKKSNFVFIN